MLPHVALSTPLLSVCTLCDNHSIGPFAPSWDWMGKVVQVGIHEAVAKWRETFWSQKVCRNRARPALSASIGVAEHYSHEHSV